MPYQFVREPLRAEEADQLSQACETMQEKLIIWRGSRKPQKFPDTY